MRTETELAYYTGIMTGISAIKDCANATKNNSMRDAAKLIDSAFKMDEKAFNAGLAAVCLLALTAESETEITARFINAVLDVKRH